MHDGNKRAIRFCRGTVRSLTQPTFTGCFGRMYPGRHPPSHLQDPYAAAAAAAASLFQLPTLIHFLFPFSVRAHSNIALLIGAVAHTLAARGPLRTCYNTAQLLIAEGELRLQGRDSTRRIILAYFTIHCQPQSHFKVARDTEPVRHLHDTTIVPSSFADATRRHPSIFSHPNLQDLNLRGRLAQQRCRFSLGLRTRGHNRQRRASLCRTRAMGSPYRRGGPDGRRRGIARP